MQTQPRNVGRVIAVAALATLVFSILRRLDLFLPMGNSLAARGWSLPPILAVMVLARMAFSAIATLIALPQILGVALSEWLPDAVKCDRRATLLGLLSFTVFGLLASAISLGMGIHKGDWSALLARPDIHPDPDVVGWGYFLLALVPGIWEELAFRGLILSRLRKALPAWVSILLSSVLFSLFHLTNLATQAPSAAIGGVAMSLLFGLTWGVMTVRTGSVLPAMLSHYLVDSMGQPFLNVATSDPVQATIFFLTLTLAFPIVNTALTVMMYPGERRQERYTAGTEATPA